MTRTLPLTVALFVLASLLLAGALRAQGGGYDLSWHTVDGGGGTSEGGSYTLTGTTGQPDAGVLSGGSYTLSGGFWWSGAAPPLEHRLYLPLVLRNP